MTAYDTRPFISPTPRAPGFHDVVARVVWTPNSGEQVITVGEYLDANSPDGAVYLACGCEEAISDLGLENLVYGVDSYEKNALICDLVNHQLAERSWAEIRCPEGTVRLELVKCTD